jgi:hypothetical protein
MFADDSCAPQAEEDDNCPNTILPMFADDSCAPQAEEDDNCPNTSLPMFCCFRRSCLAFVWISK